MQVNISSTLTVLHDGQFWVGICEHAEAGRYGACRVVFGAVEPTDTEILAFVCARWATLPFDLAADPEAMRSAALEHANPKRRQREARKQLERAGVGTKAQQAMSAGYEARKAERKAESREARQDEAERRFAMKQRKRKEKRRGR